MKLSLYILFSLVSMISVDAFTSVLPAVQQVSSHNNKSTVSKIGAIIYGWDGDEEEEGGSINDNNSYGAYNNNGNYQPSYIGLDSEIGPGQCPPEGLAVAESLTADYDRLGSFARLATAFSPPERGIGIQDIERVEVTCVRENQIELEAILCENLGCVSLSVPIKFPNVCSDGNWMDSGCVVQNLKVLDSQAESFLETTSSGLGLEDLTGVDLDELCLLNEKVILPAWWIPPECDETLAADCDSIRSLLNEDEFHRDIVALAQDGLQHHAVGQNGDYLVQKARVAAVGPAGICLKVAALYRYGGDNLQYMDVVYPFGGEPVRDVESLRAVVLGAIAAAEDKRPSHVYNNQQKL